LTIINDILDFSKIEAGKLDLDVRPFELRNTLDGMLRTLSMRARQKGLEMSWQIADEIPAMLVGDSHRLQQVLVNLVGNAIKFTSEGDVRIHATRGGDFDNGFEVHFVVSDSGIGISRQQQSVIFDPFRRNGVGTRDLVETRGLDGRQTLGRERGRERQQLSLYDAIPAQRCCRILPDRRTQIEDGQASASRGQITFNARASR
jgi:signal transduction histidine kinase